MAGYESDASTYTKYRQGYGNGNLYVQPLQTIDIQRLIDSVHSLEQVVKQQQQSMQSVISSLEQTVRRQGYVIENLKREISDLQHHALYGAFSQGVATAEPMPEGYRIY